MTKKGVSRKEKRMLAMRIQAEFSGAQLRHKTIIDLHAKAIDAIKATTMDCLSKL